MKKNTVSPRGFTLIEILVVIGIIAILAAIVIIAINPDRQFKQANDVQRSSNINAILNAVGQNIADNKGTLTGCTGTIPTGAATTTNIGTGGYDLSTCLVPTYIPALPTDPNGGTAADTKYFIAKWPSGRYVVQATSQVTGSLIQVVR
jgi:prepilin-type N-terminal cleavage/methylation domain-containing protein